MLKTGGWRLDDMGILGTKNKHGKIWTLCHLVGGYFSFSGCITYIELQYCKIAEEWCIHPYIYIYRYTHLLRVHFSEVVFFFGLVIHWRCEETRDAFGIPRPLPFPHPFKSRSDRNSPWLFAGKTNRGKNLPREIHWSNEKNPGWLGYTRDYTTQLYWDDNKPL